MTSLGRCFNEGLLRVIVAWIVPVAVGLLAGALIGLALTFMIPLGRTPRR